MKQEIELMPAFDKRNLNPKKDYGIHGVEMRMILSGELGAVQFVVYTNWQLPHIDAEKGHREDGLFCKPMGADVGYHSPTPQYEGQTSQDKCPYLDNKPCYYDGSGLAAESMLNNVLLPEGSEGVWKALKERYIDIFGELK